LRWRAFFRSLLFTAAASAIWVFEQRNYFFDPVAREFAKETTLDQWEPLLIGMLYNVFTDYLSLFVIRRLLVRSGTKPVIGLALGAVSGVAIVQTANALRFAVFGVKACAEDFGMRVFLDPESHWLTNCVWFGVSNYSFPWSYHGGYDFVFAWPAFLVFAWLPLFALGIVVARLLTPLS
jgi:hypothetical protein